MEYHHGRAVSHQRHPRPRLLRRCPESCARCHPASPPRLRHANPMARCFCARYAAKRSVTDLYSSITKNIIKEDRINVACLISHSHSAIISSCIFGHIFKKYHIYVNTATVNSHGIVTWFGISNSTPKGIRIHANIAIRPSKRSPSIRYTCINT